MSHVIKNLKQVDDSAPNHGLEEIHEARFAREALSAENTGLSYYVMRPGKRQPFGHKHDEAEEIYVVLSGSGRMKLDDDIIDIGPMDAIRVAPNVIRSFEAGPDGLETLAFGPHHSGDGELIQGWWDD